MHKEDAKGASHRCKLDCTRLDLISSGYNGWIALRL